MHANDIKYLALCELGYTTEPDFNDDGDHAVNAVNHQYEHLYNLALTAYEWFFASFFERLEGKEIEREERGSYLYEFEVPQDLLFLRGQYTDEQGGVLRNYLFDGQKIYANYPVIYIRYTKKVCEELLPPYFIEFLKYKIAAKLCQMLTGDRDLLQLLVARESEAFNEAKNADINQRPVVILPTNPFIDVRY